MLGSVFADSGAGSASGLGVSVELRQDGGRLVDLVGEDRRGWRGVLVRA